MDKRESKENPGKVQYRHGIGGWYRASFVRLHNRQLFKCILDVDQNDFPDLNIRNFVFGNSGDFYKPLEKEIAERFELQREAEKFNWNLNDQPLARAIEFLQRVGLATNG